MKTFLVPVKALVKVTGRFTVSVFPVVDFVAVKTEMLQREFCSDEKEPRRADVQAVPASFSRYTRSVACS
jgi:hypothetical protein